MIYLLGSWTEHKKRVESELCSNRAPMYHQPVYQHPAENYQQPYMNDQFSGYYEQESTAHSQTWSESDYL